MTLFILFLMNTFCYFVFILFTNSEQLEMFKFSLRLSVFTFLSFFFNYISTTGKCL